MIVEKATWQQPGAWRKPCIVHITIVAKDRQPLFGVLIHDGTKAIVEKSDLGWVLINQQQTLLNRCPEVRILADKVMPDHYHMVLQVTQTMSQSIKEVVRGYMQGCKEAVRKIGYAEPLFDGAPHYRVLTHRGQLNAMIQYVFANAERAWIKKQNPDLFKLKRETIVRVVDTICLKRTEQERGGRYNLPERTEQEGLELHFSSMGNHWLLDWPNKQFIEMSRAATKEQIEEMTRETLCAAENGAITITAAISDGEKQIARAIRTAGYPLVIMLTDGFPTQGSQTERFYKPNGVYFETCAAGRLLLLEPTIQTLSTPAVVEAVERTLQEKAAKKHQEYVALPPCSQRWRFVALNELGRMLSNRDGQI